MTELSKAPSLPEKSVVMILRGLPDGTLTKWDGHYLKDFDFDAFEGLGNITMSPDIELAKRFKSHGEALAFIKTIPPRWPTRPDGQPNRPLTATNWELIWAEDPLMN